MLYTIYNIYCCLNRKSN